MDFNNIKDLALEYSFSSKQCSREYMEDFINIHKTNNFFMFNLCDGHGGDYVANFINKNFKLKLNNTINNLMIENKYDKITLKNILKQICYQLDLNLKNNTKAYSCGSTFITVIITLENIICLNIGDSTIILNKNNKLFYKNNYHTPKEKKERVRILKTSSITETNRIDGIINISRSFGDFQFKKYKTIENPITSVPDIDTFSISDFLKNNTHPWILLASDGLFCLFNEYKITGLINRMFSIGFTINKIINVILNYYEKRNNPDNVSIIILTFGKIQKSNYYINSFNLLKKDIIENIKKGISKLNISNDSNSNQELYQKAKEIYRNINYKNLLLTNDTYSYIIINMLQDEILNEFIKHRK